MATEIDLTLRKLADAPVHPGLAQIEVGVFRQIAVEAGIGTKPSATFFALAAVGSAMFGIVSAAAPPAPIDSGSILSPFGPSAPLAPSTLLSNPR